MDPFMFWGLPFLARKNVFRQMNPNDVFNLSMTSMKSKLFIMTYHKLPPANFSWHIGRDQGNFWNGTCAVWRVEDEMQLYIRFVDPNINGINVFVQDLREGESLENPSLRIVNRTPILMSQDPDDDFLVCEKDKKRTFNQKIEIMEMISRHLLDIVNVESFELSYSYHDDLPMEKFIKCFVFDITRKFRDVTILNHLQKLKAPEFDFIMNEIEIDEMELNTIGRVKGVFTHPKIEFGRHSAVSFDNIFNLQSQKFESRMDRLLKPSEFVKLLLAWSNGEKLQNLKKLIIHHDYKLEDKNLIKKIKKRIRELEGEVPFEIMEPEQESSDEEEEGGDGGEEERDDEEEDISEESEQDDDEMVDEEQDVDEEDDESTGEQEEERVAEEAVEKSAESESDDEEKGTDKDDKESDAESDTEEKEEDSDEEPDAEADSESDSEDEVEESDNEESDADEMEDDNQDNVDGEEEDLLRIKRRSDGKVLRLQTHYGSFEIEDETAREERLRKFF
ncbi:unnamed protein product [Caenorhabditis brenneri]